MDTWTIPPEMRAKYDAQFDIIQQGGAVTGDVARALFLKSGLPPQVLAKIWALADMDADGRIDKKEFSIALWLIAMKLKGIEVPDRLPQSLLAPPPRPPPTSDPFASSAPPPLRPGPPPIPPAPVAAPVAQAMGRVPPPKPPVPAPPVMSPPKSVAPQVPPAPAAAAQGEWAVPQQSKLKFTQLFNQHDGQRTGFLSGNQARGILMQTGLQNTVLAQIWQLSDIDTDGRLTCEEFVLALYLCEMARAGQAIPTVLPPALVPPSYRRRTSGARHDSVGSVGSAGSRGHADGVMSPPVMTPEMRQEQERKRQEELEAEKERRRQREIELEEKRKRQQEQKEAARKEMERQKELEWQRQRIAELTALKQRTQEGLSLLKRRKLDLCLQVERLSREVGEVNGKIGAQKEEVATAKAFIDGMRPQRDAAMAELSAVKQDLKECSDQALLLNQEKLNMQNQLASLKSKAGNKKRELETKIEMAKKQLAQLENDIKVRTSDVEKVEKEVEDKENSKNAANHVDESVWGGAPPKEEKPAADPTKPEWDDPTKADWGEETPAAPAAPGLPPPPTQASRDAWGDSGAAKVTSAEDAWGNDAGGWAEPPGGGGVAPDGTAKYRAVYEFEARNEDELSFQPGDIINVTLGEQGEEGWLAGELRGKKGWFPETYVEPLDGGAAPTETTAAAAEVRSTPLDTVQEEPGGEILYAIYPYDSTEPGDLCFPMGAAIRVTARSGDWWTGSYNGVSGIFPHNYVSDTPAEPAADAGTTTSTAADSEAAVTATTAVDDGRQAEDANGRRSNTPNEMKKSMKKKPEIVMVVANYEASGEGQLSLVKGQLIQVRKRTDGGWWEGETHQKGKGRKSGWFPASYVKVLAGPGGSPAPSTTAAQSDESAPQGEKVKAIFDFAGQQEDELTFAVADLLIVTDKSDSSWWKGFKCTDSSRKEGLFPSNYVEPV